MAGEDDLLGIQQANAMLGTMRQGTEASPPVPARPPWWELAPPPETGVAGTNRCLWCRNIFDHERRSLAEVEHLRTILMIDRTIPFDPPVCDACYERTVTSALSKNQIEDGTGFSNHGPPNLALRHAAGMR